MPSLIQAATGTYEGDEAAHTFNLGFKPSLVLLYNETDGDLIALHINGMADDSAVILNTDAAVQSSLAITLSDKGFTVGADATLLSLSGKTFRYWACNQ